MQHTPQRATYTCAPHSLPTHTPHATCNTHDTYNTEHVQHRTPTHTTRKSAHTCSTHARAHARVHLLGSVIPRPLAPRTPPPHQETQVQGRAQPAPQVTGRSPVTHNLDLNLQDSVPPRGPSAALFGNSRVKRDTRGWHHEGGETWNL